MSEISFGKPRLVNAYEAARLLGLTYEALSWRRIKNPEISPPFIRLDRKKVRYWTPDLEEFVRRQRHLLPAE
ncbi:hypothetical protein GCM10010869_16420 [Mesorhizobium tianshanense]|uniref:Helix-turn-helix protein n=1 Tax=Mesorhizobium tianshanense TaxID=39844 RepID=A0A562NW03_9HYPH|nr:hypothetical protein [Mesorhizobium tianshanense]TWI36407.1 hypothetical protein IQ26_02920 [Mesorhizobium tianshanense]GLS36053.1 hypothetical protein GCM10010869_16420 [Mesorhizobium tianshanense]